MSILLVDPMVLAYRQAKELVIERGYSGEISWQESIIYEEITESDFLREGAWVILSCGMRESIVRRKFAKVSVAFHNWASAQTIVDQSQVCRSEALSFFNSPPKIDAIIDMAHGIAATGFDIVKESIRTDGVQYLQQFSYIGPITVFHLAKNIGFPVAKPDRHLERIAARTGYACPQQMCEHLAEATGDSIPVVDLVLWRFATLNASYLELFPRPKV